MLNLLHSVPVPTSVLNLDGTIRYVNRTAETYLGIDAAQVVGKNCHDISHPKNFTQKKCPLCQAILSKTEIDHLSLYCERKQATLKYTLHFTHLNEKACIVQSCLAGTSPSIQNKHINGLSDQVQLALKSFKAGMYEWNMQDDSAYVSNEWKMMLGYGTDEPFPPVNVSTWKDRVHPEDLPRVMQNLQKMLDAHDDHVDTIHRLKHKEGHWIWILGRGIIEYDENNDPLRMVGMHTDISEHIALQEKSTERRKILDNSLNEIYIFSAEDLKFLYLNYGAKSNTGYSFDEISDLTPLDLNPNMDKKDFLHILDSTLTQEKHTSFSSQCQRKDGSTYDVEFYLQETVFESKKAYVAIVLDVTERKRTEALVREQADNLYYLAHYDMLTDLANRVLLTDKLKQAIRSAEHSQTKFALFFIDIDKFKQINDNYGHAIGDEVLKKIAHKLKLLVNHEDTIARFGGDEFIILMQDIAEAETMKEQIEQTLSCILYIDTLALEISASVGVSIYPDDAMTLDRLLIDADHKMYAAKNNTGELA